MALELRVNRIDGLTLEEKRQIFTFLDGCSSASAYQYPYCVPNDDHVAFSLWENERIVFFGRGCLVPMLGRFAPFAKSISFHRGPVAAGVDFMLAGLTHVLRHAHSTGIAAVSILPDFYGPDSEQLGELLIKHGWNLEPQTARCTLRVDVLQSEKDILANMTSTGRYKVRRSQREAMNVERSTRHEDLLRFCNIHNTMVQDKGLYPVSPVLFESLWRLSDAENDRIALFLAYHGDDILGANLVFRTGKRAEYLYGATVKSGGILRGNVAAGYPLQWAGMQWAKAVGCHTYDFGGFSTSGEGPAQMKAAFVKDGTPTELTAKYTMVLRPSVAMLRTVCNSVRSFFTSNASL